MTKFAVYGGGPIAMLTALILDKQGHPVELWRPYLPNPSAAKRVFALNARSLHVLTSLGLQVDAHPIRQMEIWDAKTFAQIHFAAAEIATAALAYIVEEQSLWSQIEAVVRARGLEVIDLAEGEACRVEQGRWYVTNREAEFLCIADGARSKLRQALNIPCQQGSYAQQALVATVRVTKPKLHVAFQAFGPHGPLAFLPMGGDQYSIVWSQNHAQAEALLALSLNAFKVQLAQAMDYHLGEVIECCDRSTYPLHWLHVKQYYGANWVIVGDAAHHFHPLAGLGLNMSIGDLSSLDDILSKKGFSPAALGQFQRERKAQIAPILLAMQFLKNCFGNQENFWVKCRSFTIDFLDHQAFIKKMMMKLMQAM